MKKITRTFLDENRVQISKEKRLEGRGFSLDVTDLACIKYAIDNHPVDWDNEEEAAAKYWGDLLKRLSPPPNSYFETFKVQKGAFKLGAVSDGPVDRSPHAVEFSSSVLDDLINELNGPDEITVEGFKVEQ